MAIRSGYAHGQFSWIDLVARDMAAAREFYHKLFRWECVDVDTQGGPPYALFQLQGKRVAGLGQMKEELLGRRTPASWNSYINVEQIETVCDRVTQLGGQVVTPVTEVMDACKVAFIQDPTGARVGLWQKGELDWGAELMQDYHACSWNELLTRDIEAARDFYGRLFGWEFAEYSAAIAKYYVVSQQGEENAGLLQMDQRWGEMPAQWMVYFAVQSVDLWVDQVRQLGGFVQVHPFDIPEGRFAMVSDAQGAIFDMVEMDSQAEEST